MENWRQTIISQYDNSPRLLALLAGENGAIDPSVDIQAFYDAVFDPRTAVGWGLDCWGQIVGIGRHIELEGTDAAKRLIDAFPGCDMLKAEKTGEEAACITAECTTAEMKEKAAALGSVIGCMRLL